MGSLVCNLEWGSFCIGDSHTSTILHFFNLPTFSNGIHNSFDANNFTEILHLYSNEVFWVEPFLLCFGFWFVLVGKFHTVVNKTDLVGKQNFKYFCGSTTPLSTLICSYEDCVGFRERDPPQKKKKPSTQNPCISEWLKSLLCYPGEHSLLTDYLRYI